VEKRAIMIVTSAIAACLSGCAVSNFTKFDPSPPFQKPVGEQPVACNFIKASYSENLLKTVAQFGHRDEVLTNQFIHTRLNYDNIDEYKSAWVNHKEMPDWLIEYVPTGDLLWTQLGCVWVNDKSEQRLFVGLNFRKDGTAKIFKFFTNKEQAEDYIKHAETPISGEKTQK
jgi:hypothetical protein